MHFQAPCHEHVWRKEGKFNTFITSVIDKGELPASSPEPFAPGERNLVHENCIFLGYFAASSGNSLPTFRNKLLVPSSRVKNLRSLLIYFTAEASNYNSSTLWIENLVNFRASLENWVDSRTSMENWVDSRANLENLVDLVWKIGWTPKLVWKTIYPPVSEKKRFPRRPSRILVFIICTDLFVCSFLPFFLPASF
jgi:hypothetical protein